MSVRFVAAVCLALAVASCSRAPASAGPPLRDVSLPDLSRMDPPVQEQVRARYAALQSSIARPDATAADRAAAYGGLGMLLQAAEYYDAAEPAYLNAQTLMPGEPRWPYYLAHLHKSRGETDRAVAAFNRVLELRPDDVPALIWLGRLHIDQGEAEKAEPLFERAHTTAPRTVAVLVGLGQAALARKDFARSAARLEEALALDPSSASIHSPLAMAYRGLGDSARAETHLKLWRNTDVLVPDPLRQELDLALDSGLSFELRGVRALETRDFTAAAGFFRQGAALTPATTPLGRSLRHKLGTALYLGGDPAGALEQFNEVVRHAPATGLDETAAKAHYSLGVLMASAGRADEAISYLTSAVSASPNYVEALQALGDALRRTGRDRAALPHYASVLTINPQAADARFGYAVALVRLRRYREARDWVAEAMRLSPGREDFTHVMARLLAAAPDDSVRDGARALALVDQLLAGQKTVALGETTAMALAENGRFEEATAVQRQVIKAAGEAGLAVDIPHLTATLRLYEASRPSRIPWADDDPIHAPGPPITPAVAAALP
jgi:tetratricopeptide (TPR) repeat protein